MKSQDLRIVFMGTPDFAVASLKALIDNKYNVVGVITAPDRPAGRGQKIRMSAVKEFALEHDLNILQPEKFRNEDFLESLRNLKADLQIVVAFRMLPEVVWNMPPLGTFNLHGSLLPKYRGAAPINWAIMNGEKETGVTTFRLKHEIDSGDIILQEKVTIGPNDNVEKIHDELMNIGSQLVVDTVEKFSSESIEFIDQKQAVIEGKEITHAPKIFKEDCKIDFSDHALKLHNKIRGLSPYPAAWMELKQTSSDVTKTVKLFDVTYGIDKHNLKPGTIQSDGKEFLSIACEDGFIHVHSLQMQGKKRMKIGDFLRGNSEILNFYA